ncbi:MAG: hypothetical protein ACOYK6_06765 [Chthoniobacterales bacterium]
MKKFISFLICFLAASTPLLPLRLMAKGTAAAPVYVAQENPFKIGVAPERPVYAPEFVFFLEKKAAHKHCSVYSDYYDSAFMAVRWNGSTASIHRSGRSPNYTYSVIRGHEYDVICGLQSEKVQKEFNAWRNSREWTQNPTLEEDCQYITSIVQSNSADAAAIKARYPEAQELFAKFDKYTYTSIIDTACSVCPDGDVKVNPVRIPSDPANGYYPYVIIRTLDQHKSIDRADIKIVIYFSIFTDPTKYFISKNQKHFNLLARETDACPAVGEEEIRLALSELDFVSNID